MTFSTSLKIYGKFSKFLQYAYTFSTGAFTSAYLVAEPIGILTSGSSVPSSVGAHPLCEAFPLKTGINRRCVGW